MAKVASLRQAAAVARIPASELVNRLREAVGQPPIASRSDDASASYLGERPDWYDPDLVVDSLDEDALPDDGPMPLVPLLKRSNGLGEREILEFRTTFLPAPGIDAMSRKGFAAWTKETSPGEFRTYFTRAPRP